MKVFIAQIILKCLGILPKKDIIVFESFFGKQYSDNPKAIYTYLKESSENPYELIWCVKSGFESEFEKAGISYVIRGTIRWLFLMGRAKYWVNNTRMPSWMYKSPKTVYLQTWHGTPLKKLGLDINEVRMPGVSTEFYKDNFVNEAKKWDYLISQNIYATNIFERAFEIERQKILEVGYPRNEELTHVTATEIKYLKEKLQLPKGKKIILYAPTWRDDQNFRSGQYKAIMPFDLERLHNALQDEYIILIKWHYLIHDTVRIPEKYKNFIIKAPQHISINAVFKVSDMLITDYSSVVFDYANLARKIIFYIPDYKIYKEETRGLYVSIREVFKGLCAETTTELIQKITEDGGATEEFLSAFCHLDAQNPTAQVVNQVFEFQSYQSWKEKEWGNDHNEESHHVWNI
ncbi:CDP-glycerol glycerophosphotransferase family protein [Listeria costaricensis]|uniref:CDP-glycerol glycerophosphotransferase family protein n=1 Tax=Listeria costaricensis TaxID=2026604 RepID=UPI000C0896A6|nr:CDP-glycerol glycerophosphotransferase family protein [Listeria costaricensis]